MGIARILAGACVSAGLLAGIASADGSVFLTGHDPDFHASLGGNLAGARKINTTAINYIMDPAFNSFNAGGNKKFLFVEGKFSPPGGHTNGVNGIVASGYTLGTDFDHVDASALNVALDQLGTTYAGIVVASDFGGILSQAELDILNARKNDIFNFVNAGGGLYAMAEGNSGAGLTPNGGWFDFVPIAATSQQKNQSEIGNTVTAFGLSLGLTDNDVNGNASHNVFSTFAPSLSPVDLDSQGQILSLAGRTRIPTPGTLPMLAFGGLVIGRRRR